MSTSREEWTKAIAQMGQRSKYNARKKVVDGFTFDSTKEANYYQALRLREKAGEIYDLKLQYEYQLLVPSRAGGTESVGVYRTDFRYREGPTGILRVDDVKSAATRTAVYRLKKRMVEATYGIEIREV